MFPQGVLGLLTFLSHLLIYMLSVCTSIDFTIHPSCSILVIHSLCVLGVQVGASVSIFLPNSSISLFSFSLLACQKCPLCSSFHALTIPYSPLVLLGLCHILTDIITFNFNLFTTSQKLDKPLPARHLPTAFCSICA